MSCFRARISASAKGTDAVVSSWPRMDRPHLNRASIKRIGKGIQSREGEVTDEPLPTRWVELILRLNELEKLERVQGK